MSVTGLHICMETAAAPGDQGHEVGARWVCECGANFVYREGFNRGGYLELDWWSAPAVPQQRRGVRGVLFGPR
jgi:hypothetical protein